MGLATDPVSPQQRSEAVNTDHTQSPAAGCAVRFAGISKRYGESTVLHELNLDVRRGEFLTLLGPQRFRQSTILNIVAGAIQPTTGRVYLDGVDVTEVPARERGLGMVFQNMR